jgi:large subunit ribosomal protein L10
VFQNRISALRFLRGAKLLIQVAVGAMDFSSRVDLIGGKTLSLNLDDKKAVVAEVSAQVANAQTIVVAEYAGLAVGNLTVLRAKARESGVYLRVLKNTLARRAVAGTPFAGLSDEMTGPLIYSISADPVAAARVLADFAKTNDKLVLKAGSYAGQVLDKAGVQALASIPSREELLAKLLGVMQAPVSGFARVLAAIAKQREEEATA